jgi:hypothetical protein
MFISRITESHFPSSGALLDPTMTHVRPVARWNCERRINHGDGSASTNFRPSNNEVTIDGSPHALTHSYEDDDDDDDASSARSIEMTTSFYASTSAMLIASIMQLYATW